MFNDETLRLLSPAEVARLLGVCRATAYRRIHSGEIPALRLGEDGPLRVRSDQLERWLAAHPVTHERRWSMAERPEIPDELLVDMLAERGYTVEKRRETDLAALAEKVDAVERQFAEAREASAPPEDPRVKLAEGLRDRLNATMSKWYEPGSGDAA